MKHLCSIRRGLPVSSFQDLAETLVHSPLVAENTLGGTFQASRGFGMTFQASGFSTFERRFPSVWRSVSPWLGFKAINALTPFWQRPKDIPNAWYLNVLLVPPGAAVDRHIDATLRKVAQVDTATPRVVSVFYLQTPPNQQGALCLWRGARLIAKVIPKPRMIVHFDGTLAHSVEAASATTGVTRASLVIEQYHFEAEALARVPSFQVESRAGFETFLKLHQSAPTALDLET
jgi:hypothetical protein